MNAPPTPTIGRVRSRRNKAGLALEFGAHLSSNRLISPQEREQHSHYDARICFCIEGVTPEKAVLLA